MSASHVGSYSTFTASGGTTGTWDISGIDWQAGDVGFFWWYARNSSKTTPTVPATLTQKFVQTGGVGSSPAGRLYLSYRRLSSSDTESFVWTSNSFASAVAYGVDVFRGVSGSDPFAVVSSEGSPLNDNTPAAPTLTPTTNNQLVYTLMGMNSECPSIVAPTSYTIGGSQSLSNASGGALGAASAYRVLSGQSGVLQTPGDWATGAASFVDGSTRTLASSPGVLISIDQGSYSLTGSDISFEIGSLRRTGGGGYVGDHPVRPRFRNRRAEYDRLIGEARKTLKRDEELALLLISILSYDDDAI